MIYWDKMLLRASSKFINKMPTHCLNGALEHTKPSIKKAFIVGEYSRLTCHIMRYFKDKGFHYELYSPDGTIDHVLEGVGMMREYRPRVVVGVGDGVCVDAAKLSRMFYDNPDICIADLKEHKLRSVSRVTDLMTISTISSACAEMTPFTQHISNRGMWVDGLQSGMIIRDKDLMAMDKKNITFPGFQVLLQGIESFVALGGSKPILENAIRDMFCTLEDAIGGDPHAREIVFQSMGEVGVFMGGAGLGASTCMAMKLEKYFNIPFEIGMGVFFPHVMDKSADDHQERYNEMAASLGIQGGNLRHAIVGLRESIGLPSTIKGLGIDKTQYEDHIHKMSEETIMEKMNTHPLPIDKIKEIYRGAYSF